AVGPLDVKAFLFEQAFVIGDQLRQALEWRGGFEHQCLHVSAPWLNRPRATSGTALVAASSLNYSKDRKSRRPTPGSSSRTAARTVKARQARCASGCPQAL